MSSKRSWGWICAVIALLALGRTATLAQVVPIRGDANCDGRVDASDIDAVIALLFGEAGACPSAEANADANQDGSVTAADITAVELLLPLAGPTGTPSVTPTPSETPTITPSPLHLQLRV